MSYQVHWPAVRSSPEGLSERLSVLPGILLNVADDRHRPALHGVTEWELSQHSPGGNVNLTAHHLNKKKLAEVLSSRCRTVPEVNPSGGVGTVLLGRTVQAVAAGVGRLVVSGKQTVPTIFLVFSCENNSRNSRPWSLNTNTLTLQLIVKQRAILKTFKHRKTYLSQL